jgi:hypothetical protein
MAKRKDAVALFEVITATKRKEQAGLARTRAGSMLRTPKWWFKSKAQEGSEQRDGNGASYSAPALPAPADPQSTQYATPGDPTSGYASPSAVPVQSVVQRVAPPAPERVTIPERADGTAVFGLDGPTEDAPVAHRGRRSWLGFGRAKPKVDVDPDRREVTVRFRYTHAIIAGFAVCVVVGLAYVTGRQTNQANAGPGAISSKSIKDGDILAGVLDIQPDREAATLGDDIDSVNDDNRTSVQPRPPTVEGSKGRSQSKSGLIVKEPAKPAPPRALPNGMEQGLPRAKGLNYVIIQIYPDEKAARGAADALQAAGVECTVEQAPPGWTADPDWKAVIGTLGFPPRSSNTPEYRKYKDSIEAVSKSYAGRSKMKQFEPSLYRWR